MLKKQVQLTVGSAHGNSETLYELYGRNNFRVSWPRSRIAQLRPNFHWGVEKIRANACISLSVPLSILLYLLLMKHTDVQRNAFSVCSRMALRHHRDVRSVVLFGRFLHRVKRSSVAGHAFNQPLSEMFERIQEGRDGQGFREHEQSLNKRRLVLMMINTRGNNDAHRCIYQYQRNLWKHNTSKAKGIAISN